MSAPAAGRRLVLASASPRRLELLGRFGLPVTVAATEVDETARPGEDPVDLVRRLATAKATAALATIHEAPTDTVDAVALVAADTVVVLDGEVLGKPVDAADASAMLARLGGRTHLVVTGVAVARLDPADAAVPGGPAADDGSVAVGPAQSMVVDAEATEVTMVPLTRDEIAWYVGTGEPLDKAGAYGIQGQGGVFVSSIRGSHDNVVGLPLATTRRLLGSVGCDPLGAAT